MDEAELPECRPDQVAITVEWRDDEGSLRGSVDVRNVSDRTVRISGKPALLPLGADLEPVDVPTIVTAELRLPGYAELDPGRTVRADVRWSAWNGARPGDQVVVRWPGGAQQVTVTGPLAPTRRDGPTNISSSWFRPLPEDVT